jgi:pyruvate/2-oxoglutarate dehydrogenase complex dihydrolipoamide dehydrogenase (E3) component
MTYDALVIGSGQGGNPLCHRLADQGWKVALVEREHLGGTCINTGCTPTKTMVASAQVAHYVRNAARWGVHADNVRVDLPAVVARKNAIVQQFRAGQERRVEQRRDRLDLYRGHARFVAAKRIQIDGQEIQSERIFINTGTRPEIPRIEGIAGSSYLTNATVMELLDIPEHLIVVGGGYIGLEFGQMFRRFGSRVTVIHHSGQLLPREDADVATELRRALEAEGLAFRLNARTTRIEGRSGESLRLTVQSPGGPDLIDGTHLLVATGRRPNTDDLGLELAGIATDAKGFVKVNGRLETNVSGVYALGDVKGGPAFTHISYNDYQVLYANLMEGGSLTVDNRYVPYSVFTDPQLGGVGLTEREARAKGYRLKIGKTPMSSVARALERDETAGLMKVIVNADTDKILGASILAAEGGELVQILGAMMMAGAPYTVLKGAVYIHPTLAEGLWTLMESVQPVESEASAGSQRSGASS